MFSIRCMIKQTVKVDNKRVFFPQLNMSNYLETMNLHYLNLLHTWFIGTVPILRLWVLVPNSLQMLLLKKFSLGEWEPPVSEVVPSGPPSYLTLPALRQPVAKE